MSDETKSGVTRREVLKLGAVAAAAGTVGCGDGDAPGGAADAAGGGTIDAAPPPPPDAGSVDAETIDASPPADAPLPDGAPPADAAGTLTPAELLAPIDTIVVLCMENRSFDHYLGAQKLVEGRAVDGLDAGMFNLDTGGLSIYAHQLDDFTPDDPPHGWDAVHAQWNSGAMDGFVTEHVGASAADVMGYHVRDQLPVTWALADAFATCDRWFCSVLGPTWPNRFYLHGASSNGVTGNLPALGFQSIFDRLQAVGATHRNYFSDIAWATGGYLKLAGNAGIETFFDDAAAGTLPNFSIIDPAFFGAGANDDHPDHDVRLGQAFIGAVYAALAQSPQWNRCLLVVTYDEHGGFYDHVAPPTTVDERAEFMQLGVRVPTIVAGPYVRRGQVVSTQFEHVSPLSTATLRFGLDPLNARLSATADLSSCIDPALIGNPQPGPMLPPAPVAMKPLRALDARLRAEGGRPRSHVELWDAAESGRIPPHLDRRDRSLEIAELWLRKAQKLGAVRFTDE